DAARERRVERAARGRGRAFPRVLRAPRGCLTAPVASRARRGRPLHRSSPPDPDRVRKDVGGAWSLVAAPGGEGRRRVASSARVVPADARAGRADGGGGPRRAGATGAALGR